jgi:TrbL/VirB6 plasmid conjugal transfer protein
VSRRPRRSWRRRVVVTLCLATLLVLLAHPFASAASDVWGNVGPSPQLSGDGIAGRYPLLNYSLDQHFEAVEASLTGGVKVDGVPPMIAYFLASILWLATSFLANLLITLFSFAFSLDLLNGSQATGGAGALAPVSRAIHSIYANVLGEPWLVLAVAVAGIWAMWKALVQRRYSETAGALGLSLIYVVAALFFVAQPGATIGSVSKWTNQMSGAFLSISSKGSASSARQAREDAADELFDLLVFKPWVVLNFGGLEHCVRAGTGTEDSDPESVPVRPLSSDPGRDAALARRLQSGTQITADNKVCVNNANKYAPRFLRYSLGADEHDERDKEYEALNDGDASDLADAERSGYSLSVADKPATDAMEEGGQYQRLLLALVLFGGELGAFLLLGSLSIGVILAQVLLLLLLAFSPVALIAAVIPGRGHDFFKGWLEKLAGYLLRKAAYSLILAILLAVIGALGSATAQLGWLMSFGLQSLFLWAVFLQRKTLADSLIGIATGPKAPGRDASLKLLSVYAGGKMTGRLSRPLRRGARSVAGRSDRLVGGFVGAGGDSGDRPRRPRRAPLFGTSYSAPVGGGGAASGPEPRGQGERSRSGTAGGGEGAPKDAGSTARTSSRTSREAPAASATGAGSGKRSPRVRKASEKPPSGPRTEKEQRPERPSRREPGQGGRPPVRRDNSPRESDPGLSAELRRERGEALRKPSAADSSKPSREPAPPPKRRRGWRKGGGK